MRYRILSPDGDHQFGRVGIFHDNTPQAVVQAILTRLLLWTGEWFLDDREGTPYEDRILGYGTQGTRDAAIKERIVLTPGVVQILSYASSVDASRKMTVSATVQTDFGVATLTTTV